MILYEKFIIMENKYKQEYFYNIMKFVLRDIVNNSNF